MHHVARQAARTFALAATFAGVFLATLPGCQYESPVPADAGTHPAAQRAKQDAILARAEADRAAGLQVEGEGTVERLLPDDDDGSRHQRFVLRLDSGQTLLVSHNIDLADRVEDLRAGDRVAFHGEYEWNARGGVVHWTHRDPRGAHVAGWLRHAGTTYR